MLYPHVEADQIFSLTQATASHRPQSTETFECSIGFTEPAPDWTEDGLFSELCVCR